MKILIKNEQGLFGELIPTKVISEKGLGILKERLKSGLNLSSKLRAQTETFIDIVEKLPKTQVVSWSTDSESKTGFRNYEAMSSHVLYIIPSFKSNRVYSELDVSLSDLQAHWAFASKLAALKNVSQLAEMVDIGIDTANFNQVLRLSERCSKWVLEEEDLTGLIREAETCAIFIPGQGYLTSRNEVSPSLAIARQFESAAAAERCLPKYFSLHEIVIVKIQTTLKEVYPGYEKNVSGEIQEALAMSEKQTLLEALSQEEIVRKLQELENIKATHPEWFTSSEMSQNMPKKRI